MNKTTAEKLELIEDQIAACKGKGDKIKPIEQDWLQWAERSCSGTGRAGLRHHKPITYGLLPAGLFSPIYPRP